MRSGACRTASNEVFRRPRTVHRGWLDPRRHETGTDAVHPAAVERRRDRRTHVAFDTLGIGTGGSGT